MAANARLINAEQLCHYLLCKPNGLVFYYYLYLSLFVRQVIKQELYSIA